MAASYGPGLGGYNVQTNAEGQIYATPGSRRPSGSYMPTGHERAVMPVRKYQRTYSFDASYAPQPYALYGTPKAIAPPSPYNPPISHQRVRSAVILGSQYNMAQPDIFGDPPMETLDATYDVGPSRFYKPHPITYNYEANSYMGWHRRSLPVRLRTENSNLQVKEIEPEPIPYSYEPDYIPPAYAAPEPYSSAIYGSFPPASSDAQTTAMTPRKSRLRLWIILCVMVIMVAVIIAMGVAVYSQVKTQNAAFHYVCQYQGSFQITDGPILDFDGRLLDSRSSRHKALSALIRRTLDLIFSQSKFAGEYEGSEIDSFRFIVARPALEAKFLLKTKISSSSTAQDLLVVLERALAQSGRGLFRDFTVDVSSLQIEGQRA